MARDLFSSEKERESERERKIERRLYHTQWLREGGTCSLLEVEGDIDIEVTLARDMISRGTRRYDDLLAGTCLMAFSGRFRIEINLVHEVSPLFAPSMCSCFEAVGLRPWCAGLRDHGSVS